MQRHLYLHLPQLLLHHHLGRHLGHHPLMVVRLLAAIRFLSHHPLIVARLVLTGRCLTHYQCHCRCLMADAFAYHVG